jgi:hypothetical protein
MTVSAIGRNILPSTSCSARTVEHWAGEGGGGALDATSHLLGGVVAVGAERVEDALHHHHRPVDQQPEIQRAQAHQVARNPRERHQGRGAEHREGDHRGHQRPRPEAPEEREEHHHHQHPALREGAGHRAERAADEVAAVVDGRPGDVGRERRPHGGEARVEVVEHREGVGAAQHLDHEVEHLAPPVGRRRPDATADAEGHVGDVAHVNGRLAGSRHDEGRGELIGRAGPRHAAQEHLP